MSRNPHLFGAVYGIVINNNQEILLLKRHNTGYYDGGYGLPAGHIEDGESASQALIHELQEEIGITVTDFAAFHIIHRIADTRQYIDIGYKITQRTGKIKNNEPEKCERIERFSHDQIPDYIADETKKSSIHISLEKHLAKGERRLQNKYYNKYGQKIDKIV